MIVVVVLVDDHLLGTTKVFQRDVFQLDTQRLEDRLAAGQDRDILEHRLAAVTIAGRLDRGATERAPQLVDDQGRQRLPLDVLGNDQERLARLGHALEDRNQVLDHRDLLLVDQDVGVFEDRFHAGGVGDEVRAQVAAVKLHPLDPLDLGLQGLAFLDRDHAVLADLLGGLGDHLADLGIKVGGDRRDLLGLGLRGHLRAQLLKLLDDVGDRLVHPPLHQHRIDAGHDGLQTFIINRLGHHRRRGRAVAGNVRSLAGDFLDHLGAHVFILVFQLDLLGHRHSVFGDGGRAERLLNDDVAAARAQGHLDRAGQLGHAALQRLAGVLIKFDHLGCHA